MFVTNIYYKYLLQMFVTNVTNIYYKYLLQMFVTNIYYKNNNLLYYRNW